MTSQPLAALKLANQVVNARAGVRRRLRMREMTLADALVDPATQTMMVFDLCCYLPPQRNGPQVKSVRRVERLADKVLIVAQVNPLRRVGELTDRQRRVILAAWATVDQRATEGRS